MVCPTCLSTGRDIALRCPRRVATSTATRPSCARATLPGRRSATSLPLGRNEARLDYLLFVAGAAYLAIAFSTLVMPSLRPFVDPIALTLKMGELPIIFWLLIWGAKQQRRRDHVPALAVA